MKSISLPVFPELENHYSWLCSFIVLLRLSVSCYFKNKFVFRKYLFLVKWYKVGKGLHEKSVSLLPGVPALLLCFTGNHSWELLTDSLHVPACMVWLYSLPAPSIYPLLHIMSFPFC